MKTILIAVCATLALSSSAAFADGCIKGGAVGAVGGHVAGHHAVLGAVGGCVVGRHMANKKAKQEKADAARAQQVQTTQPAPAPAPAQTPPPAK